ncbi:hypothetical protein AAF712_005539 [Marasmius tenuissimus]|uniref:Uncharacterized protein n=1 Tax=Marasmius tenuissimus TaxID=585030 RepID=A0ABR3A117_9AGAR
MGARKRTKIVLPKIVDHETSKRRYREAHREALNAKARERMARLRANRSETEKSAAKDQQREWSRRSYLRNRDHILDQAADARKSAFVETYGRQNLDKYPERDVRPRNLLEMKDDPNRSSRYPKALWRWKRGRGSRREEKQNESVDREIERREEERWRLGLDDLC